jgi:response regulator RpfG family c-di-GMP phosphodiesterase
MKNKTKLLYVDDEQINLTLFEINFGEKYNVLTAVDGFAGLRVLKSNPDTLIIISDMKMPNMTGIDFIKKAKEMFVNKKFYILTGFDITDEIKGALESGLIIKYFRKPFDIDEIEESISNVIE